MATSVIPALVNALCDTLTEALPDVSVYDGFGISTDPGDMLMVGVDDLGAPDAVVSAESDIEWAQIGAKSRDETGDVVCCSYVWNGDADLRAARDRAFEVVAQVETTLLANLSLSVGTLLWVRVHDLKLMQDQDNQGAHVAVSFKIYFRARL